MKIATAAVVLTTITVLGTHASAQERKLTRTQLPAAVQRTAAEQSRDATVRGYSTEKDEGQTVYHVRTGQKRSEVQVGPDGKPLAHPE